MRQSSMHKLKLAQLRTASERIRDSFIGGAPGTPEQNLLFGPQSKFLEKSRSLTDPVLRAGPVAASKAIFDPLLGLPAQALLGRKSEYGAYAGTRLRKAPKSGKGVWGDYTPIDKNTAQRIMSGAEPGKVKKVTAMGPLGPQELFMKRKATYGGLVGWAQRNPKTAAGSGILAYLLATNPNLRQMAAGFIPGLPQNKIAPDVLREFSKQPSMADPFAGGAWK